MKFFRVLDRWMAVLSCSCFITMLIVVFLQIFCRVAMPTTPAWTEEASRYLMIYLVAFSAGLAIRNDAFVNVDTIFHLLRPRHRRWLMLFNNCILIGFFLIFFVASIGFYRLGIPQVSVTMPIFTMNMIFFSMPLLSAQMVVYLLNKQYGLVKNREVREC